MDWEAELAVVIGAPVRNASPDEARAAIGGYTVLNDVTARDWQYRTLQWLQGKTFEATTPIGPWLVTAGSKASRKDRRRCRTGCEPRHLITSKASRKGLRPCRTGEVDALSDGLCLLDPAGTVLRCNHALAELLGRPSSALLGQPYLALLEQAFGPTPSPLLPHKPGDPDPADSGDLRRRALAAPDRGPHPG